MIYKLICRFFDANLEGPINLDNIETVIGLVMLTDLVKISCLLSLFP